MQAEICEGILFLYQNPVILKAGILAGRLERSWSAAEWGQRVPAKGAKSSNTAAVREKGKENPIIPMKMDFPVGKKRDVLPGNRQPTPL